jgi:hypothetical protein
MRPARKAQASGRRYTGQTHLNFFSFYFNMPNKHAFRIRGGGEAALLLAPARDGHG